MIIDIHSHLAYHAIYPDGFILDMFIGMNEKEKNKLKRILPLFLKDKDGSAFLRQMDDAGIEKTVLLIIDAGIGMREAALSIDEIYELHYSILKKNPDRFIVFGGIDLRRGQQGLELFKKGIFDYGFKGLKLYPPLGYAMDDESLFPFYEICNENNLPVLLHTGPSLFYLKNELANPLSIVGIAKKYPNINFILAHAGHNLTPQVHELVVNTKNIYVDIAAFQSKYFNINYEDSSSPILQIFKGELNKKVLFGTDWPLFNLLYPVTKGIEKLKLIAESDNSISNNAIDNIFYKNALSII